MRRTHALSLAAAGLLLTACGGGGGDGGTTAPPTPTPSTGTPLVTGTVAPGGGSLTVAKPGDALNGLTLTVPSGAFASAANISISSTSISTALTATGVSVIGPMIRIASDQGGIATTPMTLVVPAKVPAGSVPFVTVYDSVSKRYFPLNTFQRDSTSVVALLPHLDGSLLRSATARTISATPPMRGVSLSVRAAGGPPVQLITFAIAPAVLMQDFDTGFKPGTDDWAFAPMQTYGSGRPIVGGATMTEAWYYASGQNTVPLRSRYPVTGRVTLSNRAGIRFAAASDASQYGSFNGVYANAFAVYVANTTALLGNKPLPAVQPLLDSLAFMRVRATFALSTLNAQRPVPVFIQMRGSSSGAAVNHSVLVYKAVGRRLSIADATLPGDATLGLDFPAASVMTPYTPSSLGITLTQPFTGLLGEVVDPAVLAALYTASLDPNTTVFDANFPKAQFSSANGRLFDTTYVVDSLRFWAECATCQYSFATALTPKPAGKVLSAFQTYVLQNGSAVDSIGALSANGILATSSDVPKGGELVVGFPLSAATAEGATVRGSPLNWLDWRTLTIRRLDVSMTPVASTVTANTSVTFAIAVPAAQLPKTAVYRFTWNDGTAARAADTSSRAPHAFSTDGTYDVVGEVLDSRNNQVIGRATTTITVGAGTTWSAWRIVPTKNVALPTMPASDAATGTTIPVNATRQIVAWWNAPATGVRARTFWYVAAPTASVPTQGTYARGLYVSDSGQVDSDPSLQSVLSSAVFDPSRLDDPTLAPSFAGPTVATVGTVAGSAFTNWPTPIALSPCNDLSSFAPYVIHTVSMTMSGNTATGTISYKFRAFVGSCARPRAVTSTWLLEVPFTATRLTIK